MNRDGELALKALGACSVVRARVDYPGFAALCADGLAYGTPFPQHDDDQWPRRDFRLTDRGAAMLQARNL